MNGLFQTLTETSPALLILLKTTLLLVLSWGLHLALLRANPRWRVHLWRGVLIGLLFIPIAEFLIPKIQVPVQTPPVEIAPVPTSSPATASLSTSLPIAPMSSPTHRSTSAGDRPPTPIVEPVTWRNRLQAIALGLWGLVVLLLATRRLHSVHRLRIFLKRTEPAPEHLSRLGVEVAKRLECRKDFEIRLTGDRTSPFLAGLLSPKLVIPKPSLSEERPTDTLGILAHEIAHLKSNDLFWTALSKWVGVLYWFHPLAWRIPAAHSSACEQICDSTAASVVGNSDAYSQTLARSALALMDLAPNQGLPMIRSSEISKRLANLRRGKVWGALSRRWVASSLVVGIPLLALLGSLAFVETKAERTLKSLTGYWESDWQEGMTLSLGIQEEGRFRLSFLPPGGEKYSDSGIGRLEDGGKGLVFVDQRLHPIEWKVEEERLDLTLHFGRDSSDPKVEERTETLVFEKTGKKPEADLRRWSWYPEDLQGHKFLEEAIEAYAVDHRAFPDPSNPEALQPYIQKVSDETGWDHSDLPEWEILEEKNAVYIHTKGSGGSSNRTLPKDQPWFLTLYGMEEIERRGDGKPDQKSSAKDSTIDKSIEGRLESILSAYAHQRSLFNNLHFKARWVAPPNLNFPGQYTPFAEPRTILGNLKESITTQGVYEQEYWIDSGGRYLLKSANTFRPLGDMASPDSFPTTWTFDGETYRRCHGLLYSTGNPPAFPEPRTVPTFFMDHLFNEDWLSTLKNDPVEIQNAEDGNLRIETMSETTGRKYVVWLDPERDFSITRMETTDPDGVTLTQEIEYEVTSEGFWHPSSSTIYLDPTYPVEIKIEEFALNGAEPDFEIDFPDGRVITDYRESLEIPDVYFKKGDRRTYEETIADATPFISGIVTDQRGKPISGVRVQGLSQKVVKTWDGKSVVARQIGDYLDGRVVWTDDVGRFAISFDESGEYGLRFSSEDHSEVQNESIKTGNHDLKVEMSPLGRVTGRVVRSTGDDRAPVPNVTVELERLEHDRYSSLPFRTTRITRTDSNGEFEFEGVRTYEVIPPAMDRNPIQRKITCQGATEYLVLQSGEFMREVELVLPDP